MPVCGYHTARQFCGNTMEVSFVGSTNFFCFIMEIRLWKGGEGDVHVWKCCDFYLLLCKFPAGKIFEGRDWGLVVKGGVKIIFILLWCRRGCYYNGIIL